MTAAVQFGNLSGQVGHDFKVQPAASSGNQVGPEFDHYAFVLHGA
jgi:hypothetical protein